MTMLQINVGNHSSRNLTYKGFPVEYQPDMRWARDRALWVASNKPMANKYFSKMPLGRSLSDLLADNTLWVNYDSTLAGYGQTEYAGGKEMALSPYACKMGKWTMLATLIHEVAHCNGVRGGDVHSAELALIYCGLGSWREYRTDVDDPSTPYHPAIKG